MNNEKLREEIRQVVQACPFGPLTELLNRCYVALSDPAAQHARDSAELRSLCAERDRLRAELGKANSQTAHFEREWYLRGDEIEALTAKLGERPAHDVASVPDGSQLIELLERVRFTADEAKPHGNGAVYWNNAVFMCQIALRDALAAATSAPAAQGWILVSERLPEIATDVLVYGVNHGSASYTVAGLFSGSWASQETEETTRFEPTHWMPLPAVPKGVKP